MPNSYDKLVASFPLKPIKSEEELDKASLLVDKLIDKKELDNDEQDYLTTLSYLVEAYEDMYHPMPEPQLCHFIEYLLEDCKGITVDELSKDLKVIVSSIINGNIDDITVGDLKKISSFFNIKPGVIVDLEYN